MKKTTKKTSKIAVIKKTTPVKKNVAKKVIAKKVEGLLDPMMAQAETFAVQVAPAIKKASAQASQTFKAVSKKAAPLIKNAKTTAEKIIHDAEPYLQEWIKKAQKAAKDAQPFVAKTIKNIKKTEKKFLKDSAPYVAQGLNFFQKVELGLQKIWKDLNGTQKILVLLLGVGVIWGLGYGSLVTKNYDRPEGSMVISADVDPMHAASDTPKSGCNQ